MACRATSSSPAGVGDNLAADLLRPRVSIGSSHLRNENARVSHHTCTSALGRYKTQCAKPRTPSVPAHAKTHEHPEKDAEHMSKNRRIHSNDWWPKASAELREHSGSLVGSSGTFPCTVRRHAS